MNWERFTTSKKASTRVTAVMKILLTRLQESSDTTVLSEVQEMTGEALKLHALFKANVA